MIKGDRLRHTRERRQFSQQRLGEMIGQDQQYISKLERGVLPGMTTETLEKLCRALGCSADYLLDIDETTESERVAAAVA